MFNTHDAVRLTAHRHPTAHPAICYSSARAQAPRGNAIPEAPASRREMIDTKKRLEACVLMMRRFVWFPRALRAEEPNCGAPAPHIRNKHLNFHAGGRKSA